MTRSRSSGNNSQAASGSTSMPQCQTRRKASPPGRSTPIGTTGNNSSRTGNGPISHPTGNDTPSFSIDDHIPSVDIDHAYMTQACKEDGNASYVWTINSGAYEGGKQIANNAQQPGLNNAQQPGLLSHDTFPADSDEHMSSTNSFLETTYLPTAALSEAYHGNIYSDVCDRTSTITHTHFVQALADNIQQISELTQLIKALLQRAEIQSQHVNNLTVNESHHALDGTITRSERQRETHKVKYQHNVLKPAYRKDRRLAQSHSVISDKKGTHHINIIEHNNAASSAAKSTPSTHDDAPYDATNITSQISGSVPPSAPDPTTSSTTVHDEYNVLTSIDIPALCIKHGSDHAHQTYVARDITHGQREPTSTSTHQCIAATGPRLSQRPSELGQASPTSPERSNVKRTRLPMDNG